MADFWDEYRAEQQQKKTEQLTEMLKDLLGLSADDTVDAGTMVQLDIANPQMGEECPQADIIESYFKTSSLVSSRWEYAETQRTFMTFCKNLEENPPDNQTMAYMLIHALKTCYQSERKSHSYQPAHD